MRGVQSWRPQGALFTCGLALLSLTTVAAAQAGARIAPDADLYAQNPYLVEDPNSPEAPAGSAQQVSTVSAAPSAAASSAIGSRSPETVDLDPMVVLSKAPGRYEKLTGTASRLDSTTLARLKPTGTQEALERIAGVQGFADDGFGNSRLNIGIRGLPPRRAARALILEDGVPIAPALYIYPLMYYNPPTERIHEIEVIKGAAALEHGPQTMGGVVNYITSRPRRTFGGKAQVTGGQNGYGSAYAEVGGWGTETLHPEVQLLYKRGDGYRDNNAFEQYNATFKLNWVAGPRDVVYLKFNANHEDAQATYTGLTEYSYKTDPNFNPKKDDQFIIDRYSLDVIHTRDLGYGTRTTKFYGSIFKRDWWRENDIFVTKQNWANYQNGTDTLIPVTLPQSFQELVRVGNGKNNYGNLREFYTLGWDNGWDLYHRVAGYEATLSLGARVHWERFEDARAIGNAPDARSGSFFNPADSSILPTAGRQNYETTSLSLYAAEEVAFGRLTVKPGVRVELFEQERVDLLRGSRLVDHSEYVILPGVGANYELTREVNLFGGIHRGYTPPSTSTLNFLFGGADEGLDLRSEKSWNSELGARAAYDLFSAEVAGFHLYIEDMVAPANGTNFKNLGTLQTYGVEASGSLRASRALAYLPDVHVAYTWMGSEVMDGVVSSSQTAGGLDTIDGNRLPYAPEHTVVLGLSRDFAFGLSLSGNAKYVSWVYTDYENLTQTNNRGDIGPIDGYVVYDASASYTRGRYTVFMSGKNLLDNVYVSSRMHSSPYITAANAQGILIGPRRQINVGASVSF